MQRHRHTTPSAGDAARPDSSSLRPRIRPKRSSVLRMSCSPPTTIALFQDPMSDDDDDDDDDDKGYAPEDRAQPNQRNHFAREDFVTPRIRSKQRSSDLRMSCSPPPTIALSQDPMRDDDDMEDVDHFTAGSFRKEEIDLHNSPQPTTFAMHEEFGSRETARSPVAHRTSTPPPLRPRRPSVARVSYSPPTAIALFQEPTSDDDDDDDDDARMETVETEPEAEHTTRDVSGFGAKRRATNGIVSELTIVTENDATHTPWKARGATRKISNSDLPEDNSVDITPRMASVFPDFFSPVMPSCSPSQTPRKISRFSKQNSEMDISDCSTLSMSSVAWSPSTPAKRFPPTPLRSNWIPSGTPSRYDALVRKEVLVNLTESDSTESSLDDIEAVQLIGAGISGHVYKARSSHDNKLYAIKKSRHQLRSERERQLLLQEITIFQHCNFERINFDHIVRYYRAWQEDGFLYLQTELCAGGNLTGFLNSYYPQDLPESCLWSILHDVAKGLEVIHSHNIIHLDIKPDNIFITEEGRLKIGDFGMASEAGPQPSSSRDSEGDTSYMAKELLNSEHRYPSADVFCLGITMLEIAASITLPASGELWHQLRQGQLPRIHPKYSTDLELVIRQMMHPDPLSRPTSRDVVMHPRVRACAEAASPIIAEYVFHHKAIERQLATPTTSQSVTRTPRKPTVTLPWD